MWKYTSPHVKQTGKWEFAVCLRSSNWGSVTTSRGGMGREVGRRFKGEGTWGYLCLIPVDVWQKPTQYCKAINLQLKINKFSKIKKIILQFF